MTLCPLLFPAAASAAPPAVTHLFPPGLQRGTTAELTAAGTLDPWPVGVRVGGAGVTVAPAKDKGKLAVTAAADAAPGVYWLRAFNAEGANAPVPFLVGTLPELIEAEPNDEPRKPQAVTTPAVVNGRLAKNGDVDCFAVALTKGQTLVAALDAREGPRSPIDGVLQVLSADGFVLAQNHDFRGLDPLVTFAAPKDGTFVVRVFAFPATPDASVRLFGSEAAVYRLTLTAGGFADFALPLAVNRGGTARVVGWNVPADLRVPATGDGDVTLTDDRFAGSARVRVVPHPAFDATAQKPAQPLAPPFSLTGRLAEAGAADVWAFSARKGEALRLRDESRAWGLEVNPVLQVVGQPARAEPKALHADSDVVFEPPAGGEYRVEVRDQFGGGGHRFAYLLTVAPLTPEFELRVDADRFRAEAGKPLPIPVTVTRRDGLKGDVEVLVEGPPAGVTAPAVTVKPADKSVTLTLSATNPVSGPLHIVGRAGGLTRAARFAPAEGGVPTPDLWLTVVPPPKK